MIIIIMITNIHYFFLLLLSETTPLNWHSFLPFAIGPRMCIGYKFAIAEMKTILLTLMRNFEFTAVPGFKVKSLMKLLTKPDPCVKLQITLLDKSS